MQNPNQPMQPQMMAASEVQISSVAMLHELMSRTDYVLPALKCRWTTL